ncbi:MAG: hypothetical protein ACON4T_02560 [Synechococcus sp.]
MESAPSPADDHTNPQPEAAASSGGAAAWSAAEQFRERFDALLPELQRRWPEVTAHTLEATRGSLDEAVRVIALQSGRAANLVQAQLEELLQSLGDGGKDVGKVLQPLELQLEQLLDDLNQTLRPRIERPVRQRPLLALAVAAGVGVVLGALLVGGRRSE